MFHNVPYTFPYNIHITTLHRKRCLLHGHAELLLPSRSLLWTHLSLRVQHVWMTTKGTEMDKFKISSRSAESKQKVSQLSQDGLPWDESAQFLRTPTFDGRDPPSCFFLKMMGGPRDPPFHLFIFSFIYLFINYLKAYA